MNFTLSPDTYSVVVLSDGYEPLELPPVQISPGATAALGPVELHPGSSRIDGRVLAYASLDPSLQVELLGDGRHPCATCAARVWEQDDFCAVCGYSTQSSKVPVSSTGRFDLGRLASGPYALRLVDGDGRMVGAPLSVDLRPAEALPVELAFTGLRSVLVEIVDTDGRSLAEEWAKRENRSNESAPEDFEVPPILTVGVGGPEAECTFRFEDAPLATAVVLPPPPPGAFTMRFARMGSCCIGCSFGRGGDVDDRPRRGEPLRPVMPRPEIEPSKIESSMGTDGLVKFERLPCFAMTLDWACGPFAATAEVPYSRGETRIRLVLTRSQATESADGEAATLDVRSYRELEEVWYH